RGEGVDSRTVQISYQSYFKAFNTNSYIDSASLVYTIGCHSGLSVIDSDLSSDAPYTYKVDFPSAANKQGGNWLGNTGYGYGDSDLIAYSEKLAVLFTKAIGRKIMGVDPFNGQPGYLGPTIGKAPARPNRQ